MSDRYLRAIDQSAGCSRRHAIKVFAAATGGAILGGPLIRRASGVPWDHQRLSTQLVRQGAPLGVNQRQAYEQQIRQTGPTLALEPDGKRVWTSWTTARNGTENIWLRPFSADDGRWGDALCVSEAQEPVIAIANQSEIAFVGGRVLVVWTEYTPNSWRLQARSIDSVPGHLGPTYTLAGSAQRPQIISNPTLAVVGDQAVVAWQAKPAEGRSFAVLARLLRSDGQPGGDAFAVSADPDRDCCRPDVAAAPDGRGFAIAYDRQDGPGRQNVYVVTFDAQGTGRSSPLAVTSHPASDVCPALAYAPDGEMLWVAWHSNRRSHAGWDIPHWYRLTGLRLRDETWHEPVAARGGPPPTPEGQVQGFELVRLAVANGGMVCVLGRASHNFYLQYYTGDERSPIYRLPQDGWGGRGRLLRGCFDGHGSLWTVRRDIGANVLQRIDGFDDGAVPPTVSAREKPANRRPRTLTGVHTHYDWPSLPHADGDLNLYFGDLHGHSWQSDGMSDPEESFLRVRDVLADDFHALTDHDRFISRRISDGQWQQQKDLVDHYHAPGRFVTLYGQEWTTPRTARPHGWGHFCILSSDRDIPLFDHGDPRYRDLPDLLAALRGRSAVAIPHHIGWTGIRWDVWDAVVSPVIEVCSVHGAFEYEGNTPIPHRGGVRGCFIRDGLNQGLRFGLAGGSDQHGLIWHHGVCRQRDVYRAGLTGVWAPELTRRGILDAIRARHTFATSGVKLRLSFAVDGGMMGSETEVHEAPSIAVDVAVPPAEGKLAWLEIVRDGLVINRYGGEGQRSRYTFVDPDCPPGTTSYYYLRVLLADGNIAWSSPVWVTRA